MNDFEVEVMVQTATTQKKRKRILATTEDMFEEELAGLSDSNDEDAPGPSVTQVKAQAEPGQGAHSKVKAEKSAVDKAAGPKKGGQSALAACGLWEEDDSEETLQDGDGDDASGSESDSGSESEAEGSDGASDSEAEEQGSDDMADVIVKLENFSTSENHLHAHHHSSVFLGLHVHARTRLLVLMSLVWHQAR